MSSKPTTFTRLPARQRITQVVEGWFLTEPLLFAAWTMHEVAENPAIETIRVAGGRVEYACEFIESLRRDQLSSVLAFEAMRILLGHPYSRRQPRSDLSYQASNFAVQECLRTSLPMPRARDVLEGDVDDQYFEFYYRELAERATGEPEDPPPDPKPEDDDESESDSPDQPADDSDSESDQEPDEQNGEQETAQNLEAYVDHTQVGAENAGGWDSDDLRRDEITAAVKEAADAEGWGSVGGQAKEQLLATLNPKLDYRGVLRNFRQSVLSVRRRLTRMKPSRRYGFDQMGSRYDLTTKLLFAVDVSGSMSHRDLQLGFSVVSRFFRYGVEAIDVIWFDEEIRCEPMTLRRARNSFEVMGRGGTDFQPLIDFIDGDARYDGLIVFTDGYAPAPRKPKNKRTQLLWLFKDEQTYEQMHAGLQRLGRSAFLQAAS